MGILHQEIPSGYSTVCYGTLAIEIDDRHDDLLNLNMVIVKSYVKLPESMFVKFITSKKIIVISSTNPSKQVMCVNWYVCCFKYL